VQITKLEATDGFLVTDLADVPAVGVTRLAPKVLPDGAELLARSLTYSFAAFGLQISGGSAGINAKPDDRDRALAAYLDEVAPLAADGRWRTWAGVGVADSDLAPLDPAGRAPLNDPQLIAAAAVAAAQAVVPDAESVAVVAGEPVAGAARTAAEAAGLTVAGDAVDADVDVVLVAGKAGVVDHDNATGVRAKAIVPLSAVPVTAKAYAVLSRAGVVYVPDFLVLAAPLLAELDGDGSDPVARVVEAVVKFAPRGVDMWRAAVGDAEAFLGTWQDALPFGRPLA